MKDTVKSPSKLAEFDLLNYYSNIKDIAPHFIGVAEATTKASPLKDLSSSYDSIYQNTRSHIAKILYSLSSWMSVRNQKANPI